MFRARLPYAERPYWLPAAEFELRSAPWLPVYLVGMGLIVYLSDFGPTANPWFPLWWDMLAVAVFALAIYYWALRVALPAETIQRLIDRGAAGETGPQRRRSRVVR